MVDSVATILTPDNSVWKHYAVTIDGTATVDDARLRLMDVFARDTLGSTFERVTQNDAWNIWQVAERNGYRMEVIAVVPATDESSRQASAA
jgi:hypothetical protein